MYWCEGEFHTDRKVTFTKRGGQGENDKLTDLIMLVVEMLVSETLQVDVLVTESISTERQSLMNVSVLACNHRECGFC